MKKIQHIISVSVFIFVLFAISFGQSNRNEPSQGNKIAVVYTYEFSNVKTGIQEFLIASRKVDDKFKVQIEDLKKNYEEMQEFPKKIMIANRCCENCKIGETEALIKEFEEKSSKFCSEQDRLKQEVEIYQKEILEPVIARIKVSLESFARNKGFVIILDGSKSEESNLLIETPEFVDITKEFIKFYNEFFEKEKSQ